MSITATSSPASTSLPPEATADPVDEQATAHGPWAVLSELVHDRAVFVERIRRGEDLEQVARTLLLCTLICCAGFGATVGLFRGGVQILYAAVKVPLVVMLTTALCGPFLVGLRTAFAGRGSAVRDLVALLCGTAFGSLFLAALLPVMISLIALDAGYHAVALALAGCGGTAALAGTWMFLKTLDERATGLVPVGVFALVAALVTVQLGWTFRPYLVRPRSPEVVFMRALDEELGPLDAVLSSYDSARGVYRRDEAPLPEMRR